MSYTVFNTTHNDATKEPMFLGQGVNVSRFDKQHYAFFENITQQQLSFFWRPEEIDVSKDRMDFMELPEHEKHIFVSNLKYQTLLDSVQGRSPNVVLLPLVSIPELETWIETWAFFESIHARSYTHIIRNIFNNPSEVLDDIVVNPEIIKRAESISQYYDSLHELSLEYQQGKPVDMYELKRRLYLCIMSVNVLEAIRFYVSFACSFAFAERKLMEGNAKIIKMIARDEALHLNGTQHMLKLMLEEDADYQQIANECKNEIYDIFWFAYEQEKAWIEYLFKDGSMIGLNTPILTQYLEYITALRMKAIGLRPFFNTSNPIPWINAWLSSDNVQVAPQETEITSYLVGQIDAEVSDDAFNDFEL
ncbi:class Ia ribonucleoside-diphosphate reductase subunit beta [Moraxella marmotae]|uniref:class Ia ribonucleoside-diphosphate reductase subunit beta n=1 Tax=Moraxella marmotae TaxID=3344520 RepID=UPI0035F255EF